MVEDWMNNDIDISVKSWRDEHSSHHWNHHVSPFTCPHNHFPNVPMSRIIVHVLRFAVGLRRNDPDLLIRWWAHEVIKWDGSKMIKDKCLLWEFINWIRIHHLNKFSWSFSNDRSNRIDFYLILLVDMEIVVFEFI